jgi:hypothetical protein
LNGGVGWTDEGSRWTDDGGRFSASDVGFPVTTSLRIPGKGQQGRTGQQGRQRQQRASDVGLLSTSLKLSLEPQMAWNWLKQQIGFSEDSVLRTIFGIGFWKRNKSK